jgi:hypothetical protein
VEKWGILIFIQLVNLFFRGTRKAEIQRKINLFFLNRKCSYQYTRVWCCPILDGMTPRMTVPLFVGCLESESTTKNKSPDESRSTK